MSLRGSAAGCMSWEGGSKSPGGIPLGERGLLTLWGQNRMLALLGHTAKSEGPLILGVTLQDERTPPPQSAVLRVDRILKHQVRVCCPDREGEGQRERGGLTAGSKTPSTRQGRNNPSAGQKLRHPRSQ